MLPLPRFSSVSGVPLSSFLPKEKLDEIVQNTKQVAAKVIELKGATVHAPGNAISAIVETVVRDRKQVIPVSNPLDPMAYITQKVSGFDRSRVFGMGGMLDLSRFRQFIHESTGHSRDSIRGLVIGEHGENMLPLTRFSSVSGVPLSTFLPKEKLDEIVQNTKQVAAKVIELKGATVHAPGNAISAIIETVVRDRKQVIPVATYLDGEYGHSDVTIGVPAVIGKNGIEKIIELDLNDEERQMFDKGVVNVKNAISGIEI